MWGCGAGGTAHEAGPSRRCAALSSRCRSSSVAANKRGRTDAELNSFRYLHMFDPIDRCYNTGKKKECSSPNPISKVAISLLDFDLVLPSGKLNEFEEYRPKHSAKKCLPKSIEFHRRLLSIQLK